jgi:hypothetical protein
MVVAKGLRRTAERYAPELIVTVIAALQEYLKVA